MRGGTKDLLTMRLMKAFAEIGIGWHLTHTDTHKALGLWIHIVRTPGLIGADKWHLYL